MILSKTLPIRFGKTRRRSGSCLWGSRVFGSDGHSSLAVSQPDRQKPELGLLLNHLSRQVSQVSIRGMLALRRQLVCQSGQKVPEIADVFRRLLVLGRDGDPI